MVSGPCGGALNGKCEVNSLSSCVWNELFFRWAKMNSPVSLPQFCKDYDRPVILNQEGILNAL
ncbi:methylenetetrahydrofolate reductase C-terminal domain-containing protein [Desulfosporosinus sp. BICA1-9]|uniref:methylenetetrahydrofolate reductase C-terminal domain-containing protein n=1 Tax=Desulfosporosinus sp. BICA1-9 TaxID=1531958 RepID=UPI00345434A7